MCVPVYFSVYHNIHICTRGVIPFYVSYASIYEYISFSIYISYLALDAG